MSMSFWLPLAGKLMFNCERMESARGREAGTVAREQASASARQSWKGDIAYLHLASSGGAVSGVLAGEVEV